MSAQSLEKTMARLYTDRDFRNLFLSDPGLALVKCELTAVEQADMMAIDKAGLLMASHSFYHKRKLHSKNKQRKKADISASLRYRNLVVAILQWIKRYICNYQKN